MVTIQIPMTSEFEARGIALVDRFQEAKPGEDFRLCLYDSGTLTADAVLAFHDIVQTRPKGIRVHIHSHICLMNAEVLVWLAGDTRTLRRDAWIHFREYPRHLLGRSDFQRFVDSLEGRDAPAGRTAFQENYLQIERLVKGQMPTHLMNRRVWSGELAEWNVIKPALPTSKPVAGSGPSKTRPAQPAPTKAPDSPVQKTLF